MSYPDHIVFVDIETTGTSMYKDRAIEIAALKVEKGLLVDTFHTMVNPQTHVSPYIQTLTGIKPEELLDAPLFEEIAADLEEFLRGSMFISHNVRFDYGFIKTEFKRVGIEFSPTKACTVRLSRHLFPAEPRHDLDSVMQRFNITCEQRHRALDDARAIWQFVEIVKKTLPEEAFLESFKYASKRASSPIKIAQSKLDALPETPGVYIFANEVGTILYVGKSVNIRERVLSHFTQNDNPTDLKICREVADIETVQTAGELGALIKEAELIKKLSPVYNRMLRHRRELIVAQKYTLDEYDYVKVQTVQKLSSEDLNNVLGIFKSKRQATQFLQSICKDNQLCPKLLGLESASRRSKGSCMHSQFGWCKGACTQKELAVAYNIRLLQAVDKTKIDRWPFDGKITIAERNHELEIEDLFEVNNWCAITVEGENFDLDMYKILRRYLRNKKNLKNISYQRSGLSPAAPTVPLAFAD